MATNTAFIAWLAAEMSAGRYCGGTPDNTLVIVTIAVACYIAFMFRLSDSYRKAKQTIRKILRF